MSDIFDEVDDILNEVDQVSQEQSKEEEVNFNESELQDIMSEIDSLEEGSADAKPAILDEVQKELESGPVHEEVSVMSSNVEKIKPVIETTKPEISFEASGEMSLNLSFKIGTETAKLFVHPEKGLTVTMNGVELSLSADSGCKVVMDNGVQFNIPLTANSHSHKKAA